jgi:sialate O-acetylesterase
MSLRKFLLFLPLLACTAQADVRLHGLFSDNMVLQRGIAVPIWGWADEGEEVTVQFGDQTERAMPKSGGRWMVRLKKLKAGEPRVLKVSGRNTIVLTNVVAGEVWIASGQSNMEMALKDTYSGQADAETSSNPMIRLYTVPKLRSESPKEDVIGKWQTCGPKATPGFSAVAYYFARDLQKALGVPVGVIHTSWGGSPAEVWIREDLMSKDPEYRRDIMDTYAGNHAKYLASVEAWKKEKEEAEKAGQPFTKRQPYADWKPAELYNGMIANLIPFAVNGAIWYQGESNAGRAWQYRRLFADMIKNWRDDWDRDFTFLEVQLAPFDNGRRRTLEAISAAPEKSTWAELREAQLLATKNLKRVGMAVITDVGDKDDIHPTKKEPVGARLALLARKITYGEKIVADGPTFSDAKFKDGKATLSFKNVGGGLEAKGGSLSGFAIAGTNQVFVWATANIEGDKVVVSNSELPQPAAVRYGWADFPVVNLFNKKGLPATPFRTDDWKMVTKPEPKEPKK